MENTSENKEITNGKERVKRISLGILAHVDAGKTTLSEALCKCQPLFYIVR